MNLALRVRRLEGVRDAQGFRLCACKGAQPPVGVYQNDEPRPVVAPAVCPRCLGLLMPVVVHLRDVAVPIDYLPDAREANRPRAAADRQGSAAR